MLSEVYWHPTSANGHQVLRLPSHRAIRWMQGPWEAERIASMRQHIGPGDVVYDVGAEEGDMSALWASWVGPSGGVVLVEPNPKVWPCTKAIFEENALPPPLGWWVGFLSARTEEHPPAMDVTQDGGEWPACADGLMIPAHGFRHLAEQADTTPQITLDELVDRVGRPPTAITIDVEGAELSVLVGALGTLHTFHPDVWVSIHPEFMRRLYDVGPEDLHAFMEGIGYRYEYLATDHEVHGRFTYG